MRKGQIVKAASLFLLMVCVIQVNASAKELSNVVILGTGGTIAGKGSSKTGVSYTAGELSINSLINSVPGIEKLANLTGENVANVPSQDMTDAIWLKLANRVNEVLKNPSVAGVVITHGTDTMEETAYFLDLVVKTNKPIVVTGSMRPSTSLSADGPINILNSVAVAASPLSIGKGVLVVMNGEIYSARDVTKTNTTSVATFKSPNSGPIGIIDYTKVRYYATPTGKHTANSEFDITKIKELPKVCVLYEVEGGIAPLIKAAIKLGYKGIVLAGLGDGNMPTNDENILKEAVSKGITVVVSSRVGSGCVQTNAEVKDTKYKFITANDLNPQKARILLRVALTQTNSYKELQKIFNAY